MSFKTKEEGADYFGEKQNAGYIFLEAEMASFPRFPVD